MSDQSSTPAGWYHAPGDPPDTQRYWDGAQWTGEPQPVAAATPPPTGGVAPPPVPGAMAPGVAGGANPDYDAQLGVTLANPGMRILARFIDGIILFIPGVIIATIVGASATGFGGDFSFGSYFIYGVIAAAIYFGYEYLMLNATGATVGKMVLGFKVIREDGQPLESNDSMMRAAVWGGVALISNVIPFLGSLVSLAFYVVCIVFLFSKPRHQDIPDLFAKTVVITTK